MRNAIILVMAGLIALGSDNAAQAAHGPGQPRLGVTFVPLDEITTPIVGDSRIEGALSVTLVIEAKDARSAIALKSQMPRLRARSLTATIEFARLYASGFLPVDVQRLGADLNAALKPDHPGIARVLITRVIAVPA